MDLKGNLPMAIYDDKCSVCVNFAKTIDFFTGSRIKLVGNHSKLGLKIRDEILGDDIFEMFWFLDRKTAYGGRSSFLPLLRAVLTSRERERFNHSIEEADCKECSTVKMVFIRTGLLLAKNKKVKLK